MNASAVAANDVLKAETGPAEEENDFDGGVAAIETTSGGALATSAEARMGTFGAHRIATAIWSYNSKDLQLVVVICRTEGGLLWRGMTV